MSDGVEVGRDERSRAEAPRSDQTTLAHCQKCHGLTLQTERRSTAGRYEVRDRSCLACGAKTSHMRSPQKLKQARPRRHDLVKAKPRLYRP